MLELEAPEGTVVVSRADLFGQNRVASDSESDVELGANIEFEFEEHGAEEPTVEEAEEQPAPGGEMFSIFSSGPALVESSDEEDEVIERPQSYYFASYTADDKKQFSVAAVDASEIYEWSKQRLPGMEMPSRVINFTEMANRANRERQRARRRPSKKARDAMRQHLQTQTAPQSVYEEPKYGPERTYANPKIGKTTHKRRGGHPRKPGSGGGYPRKPGS
uniref:ARAD1C33726p n=1 Tax=Blastobotrys adeninivorans TaxID=409370 RepID=A0A060T3I5_BLAAD